MLRCLRAEIRQTLRRPKRMSRMPNCDVVGMMMFVWYYRVPCARRGGRSNPTLFGLLRELQAELQSATLHPSAFIIIHPGIFSMHRPRRENGSHMKFF